jgi:hypothetical protein
MGNEVFTIQAEEDTPFVSMEKKDAGGSLVIKGISMPENPLEFYSPLHAKVPEFFGEQFSGLQMEIDLQYMNSMSNKQLLKLIKNIMGRDPGVKILWKHQPGDDLMQTKGHEIKSIFPQLDMEVSESTK